MTYRDKNMSLVDMMKNLKSNHFYVLLGGIIVVVLLTYSYIMGSITRIKRAYEKEVVQLTTEKDRYEFSTIYNHYLISLYNFDRYSSFDGMDRDAMYNELSTAEDRVIDFVVEKYEKGEAVIEEVVIDTDEGPVSYAYFAFNDSPEHRWLLIPYIKVEVNNRLNN